MTVAPPPFIPGAFVGAAHHYRARVYFEDTDLSGIVYHANYLRYMERARSDMLRLAGIDQRAAMEAGDGVWAVTDLAIKYRRPAKLDDDLLVVSTVERSEEHTSELQSLMRISYAVFCFKKKNHNPPLHDQHR